MLRVTSWEAYKALEESGALGALTMQVLRYVCQHPNCTSLECVEYYRNVLGIDGQVLNKGLHQRFSELVKMGLIYETGEKVYGNHKRISYAVTGETIPQKKLLRVGDKERKISILKEALQDIFCEAEYSGMESSTLTRIATSARTALFAAGFKEKD